MYRYVRVDSDLDRQDWLRTRQNVYLGSGLITSDDLRDGLYQDTFDARCHHLLACDQDGEAVGSARLIVRDGDAAPLHLEGHFAMDIEASSAEISGLTVVPGHRTSEVMTGLFRAVYELGREQRITWLYAVVEPPFLKAIQQAGYPFEAVTEPKWIYNTWNFVIRTSLSDFIALVTELAAEGRMSPVSKPFAFQTRRPLGGVAVLSDDVAVG
jgi:N-acyl-L-homoserine lactone synthetase